MFELSPVLKQRLIQYGEDEESINRKIEKYKDEAGDYISLALFDIEISDKQKNILVDNYIQYQLFSMLEMESLVEDKREFLENLIETIKENKKEKDLLAKENKEEKSKSKGRIMVF